MIHKNNETQAFKDLNRMAGPDTVCRLDYLWDFFFNYLTDSQAVAPSEPLDSSKSWTHWILGRMFDHVETVLLCSLWASYT